MNVTYIVAYGNDNASIKCQNGSEMIAYRVAFCWIKNIIDVTSQNILVCDVYIFKTSQNICSVMSENISRARECIML